MLGKISENMEKMIESYVKGRTIWNLGSGTDDSEARMLASFGAKKIYSVDKNMSHRGRRFINPQFNWNIGTRTWECNSYFDEFEDWVKEEPDVIFIKWPDTNAKISRLINRSPIVIYIGRNDKATSCGSSDFWAHVLKREIENSVEEKENDMIVYGRIKGEVHKPRVREEEEPYNLYVKR